MMDYIPYGSQSLNDDDIQAVIEVLQSSWLTQGPAVRRFEQAIENYCDVKHAVAYANGTAALHGICAALEIGAGDIVWTSPNTFVASSNCALYCGASIDFVDICPQTYNLCAEQLEQKLIAAKKINKLPKLVIPVHFAGHSCEMKKIKALADQYGFYVVEDACHAIGGRYRQQKVGSCQYSDAAVFSFHPVKNMTTAEGGVVTTNNPQLAAKLQRFRTHGITKNKDEMIGESHGDWYYQQIDLGFNYRITDLQCAMGISQLGQLDTFIDRRQKLVDRYHQILAPLPLIRPKVFDHVKSAHHLYVIQIDNQQTDQQRKAVFDYLRSKNIGVIVHYIPVHTQPFYQRLGFTAGQFPVAEQYYSRAITLPLFPKLTDDQQDYNCGNINGSTAMKVAIIPARGGSQRIPRKNIRQFIDRPIIAYSIQLAVAANLFDRVLVSTDDQQIAEIAIEYGAEVPFMRPDNLSDHITGTNAVVKHAIEQLQANGLAIDYACCIYATAPLLQLEYLTKAYYQLINSNADFVFAATAFNFPIQRALLLDKNNRVSPFNKDDISKRSQDLTTTYHDAGQFYWGRAQAFVEQKSLFAGNAQAIVLPNYLVQDIDDQQDWRRAELLYQLLQPVEASNVGR